MNAGQAPYQNSLELLMFFFKPGSHYASDWSEALYSPGNFQKLDTPDSQLLEL